MTRTVRVLFVGDGDERVPTVLDGVGGVAVGSEPDPERALDRVREETVDCVLAREGVPRAGGRPFPAAVRAADPGVAVVLLTTGESDRPAPADERVPDWTPSAGGEALARRIHSAVEGVDGTVREAELARAGAGIDCRQSSGFLGTLDAEGWFDHVSPAVDRLLGYDPGDLAGRPATEFVHPGDREALGPAFETLFDDAGQPMVVEFRLRTTDGGWVWTEHRAVGRPDGEDPVGLVHARDRPGSGGDPRRLEAMVKHSSDVITLIDPDGTIRYESPATRRVKGVDPGAVVGRSGFEFVHPDDHGRIREALSAIADSPGAVTDPVEYRIRDDDGEWRWLESVASNPGPGAPVEGYVVNTRNVTRRVERERQLRVLDRVLRHNVRNHLDVVMGHTERVTGGNDVDTEEACDTVLDACRDLLATVEKERAIVELLTDSPERVPVDLSATVRDAVARVRERYPGASVAVTCPRGVGVEAVPTLERAVLELVENAVEHGGDPVEVTVRRRDGTAVLTVADRGARLPDDEVAVLLDAREGDQLHHGSGMGLWLVHWIVRRSGGDLAFEPREPLGNVVTVTLRAPSGA